MLLKEENTNRLLQGANQPMKNPWCAKRSKKRVGGGGGGRMWQ